jgi:hypothetical protein
VRKSLLAESKSGMTLTEIVACNDGTLTSDFSKEIISLVMFEWER